MTTAPREWDARTYHRVSDPQFAWGQKLLSRLELRGDETVLDAGCGSGRLTAVLAERLPQGRVLALDASTNMLDQAQHALAQFGPKVELLQADLAALTLNQAVDVVFSNATFHWVLDHQTLFNGVFRALRPGGRLLAQCGGAGNLDRLRTRARRKMTDHRFAASFEGFTDAWYYAGPEDTERRLQAAGFVDAKAWLEPAPTRFANAEAFRQFLEAVVLRVHVARLTDPPQRQDFLNELVDEAAADPDPYTLDYVRLNLEASRPT